MELERDVIRKLKAAMAPCCPAGVESRALIALHRRWICGHWGESRYSAQTHLALGEMYLADDKFRDYYDSRSGAGATESLVTALHARPGATATRRASGPQLRTCRSCAYCGQTPPRSSEETYGA